MKSRRCRERSRSVIPVGGRAHAERIFVVCDLTTESHSLSVRERVCMYRTCIPTGKEAFSRALRVCVYACVPFPVDARERGTDTAAAVVFSTPPRTHHLDLGSGVTTRRT